MAVPMGETPAGVVEARTPEQKLHVSVYLIGVTLFGLKFFIPSERTSAFLVWTACCLALSIYIVCALLVRRLFIFGALSMCLTYGVGIVWISNFVIGIPMSSWRLGWESKPAFPEALGTSIQYLTFFNILAAVAISFLPVARIGRFESLGYSYRGPVLFLMGCCALVLLTTAGKQARDSYAMGADVGSMFLVQASSIMLASLYAFTLFYVSPGVFRRALLLTLAGVAVVVGMNGFRFLLIIFAFISLCYLLSTRRLPLKWTLGLTVAAATAYLLLLILAYTRAKGLTFTDALAFIIDPDLDAAMRYVGASDQTNIIAQDYYSNRSELRLDGRTYLDAFLRLVPNVVHSSYFDTIRSQDYIVQTGAFVPDAFRQSKLNIGSHLFVEAIINFGKNGPYFVLTAYAFVIALLEKFARSSRQFFLGYIVTASMAYSLAWYGFTNSLKQGVYAFICGAIIIMAGTFADRGRNQKRYPKRSAEHLSPL